MNAWAMLEKVHPPRPDWCEEFYASVLNTSMKSYEDEVSDYKLKLVNVNSLDLIFNYRLV